MEEKVTMNAETMAAQPETVPEQQPQAGKPSILAYVIAWAVLIALAALVVWVVVSIIRKIIMWFWIIVAGVIALIIAPLVLPFLWVGGYR